MAIPKTDRKIWREWVFVEDTETHIENLIYEWMNDHNDNTSESLESRERTLHLVGQAYKCLEIHRQFIAARTLLDVMIEDVDGYDEDDE